MENDISLFNSLLRQVEEYLIPKTNYIIEKYESLVALKYPQKTIEKNLVDYFSIILKSGYFTIFHNEVVTEIAQISPTEVLHSLSTEIKNFFKMKTSNFTFNLLNSIQNFNRDSIQHQNVVMYSALYVLSILITEILVKTKSSAADTFLSRIGLKIVTSDLHIKPLGEELIKQWAVIFSIISERSHQIIQQTFFMITDMNKLDLVFLLIRYIRLDHDPELGCEFMPKVLQILKNMKSKKLLNARILKSITYLFYSFPYNHDIYQSFFDFAQTMFYDRTLGPGAILLASAVLSNGLETLNKHIAFIKTTIVPLFDQGKPNWAFKSFRNFLLGKGVDLRALFWRHGANPRISSLAYIRSSPQNGISSIDSRSFFSLFTSIFMPHLGDLKKHDIVVKMLVHLASIDFTTYITHILPLFMKEESEEIKKVTFLRTVSLINTPDFLQHAAQIYNAQYIQEFNRVVKKTIIAMIDIFDDYLVEESFMYEFMNNKLKSQIRQADLLVGEIIEAWGLNDFQRVYHIYSYSQQLTSDDLLQITVLKALKYTFPPDDIKSNDQILKILIYLIGSSDKKISEAAIDATKYIFAVGESLHLFIKAVKDFIYQPQDYSPRLFMIVNILYEILENTDFSQLSENEMNDIDFIGFYSMMSSSPELRIIGYRICAKVSAPLKFRGAFSAIDRFKKQIEEVVKKKVVFHKIWEDPGRPSLPDGQITLSSCIASNYATIWIKFIAEIIIVVTCCSLEPIRKRLEEIAPGYVSKTTASGDTGDYIDVAMILGFFASHCDHRGYALVENIYQCPTYYDVHHSEEFRPAAFSLMTSLLSHKQNWCKTVVFASLDLCHPFFLPSFFGILPGVKKPLLPQAARSMIRLLSNPFIQTSQIRSQLRFIMNFLAALQGYFASLSINNARAIKWDPELEKMAVPYIKDILCFEIIIPTVFDSFETISLDDWPVSSREISFRYLVNWGMTKSSELKVIRVSGANAMKKLIMSGRIISDGLIFDDSAVQILAEHNILFVLREMLMNQPEVLIAQFVENCFLQTRIVANSFFDAILAIINDANIEILYLQLPCLILLALVFENIEHPRANEMLTKLLGTYAKFPDKEGLDNLDRHIDDIDYKSIPSYFGFATEAVFSYAFYIIGQPNLHIPPRSIIDAIKPFAKSLRFLPKQKTCSHETIPLFAYFTPYQFMKELMKATEAISDDHFDSIISIWKELMKSPDHVDMIPTFIFNGGNPRIVAKIVHSLLVTSTSTIFPRLADEISFAHYLHVTRCLNEDFERNLWTVDLLSKAITTIDPSSLGDEIYSILHFALIFADVGSLPLLIALADVFRLPSPAPLTDDAFALYVKSFAAKTTQPEKWLQTAAKWVLGSRNIHVAAMSLLAYINLQSFTDKDDVLVVMGVAKAVNYHLVNNASDVRSLTLLVSCAFKFYTRAFQDNSVFAFNFVKCFFNCRTFFDALYSSATELCIMALTSQSTNVDAWTHYIAIVRPLLYVASSDYEAQQALDNLLAMGNSEELLLAVAPIKSANPESFPSIADPSELLSNASVQAMESALSHYCIILINSSHQVVNEIFKFCTSFLPRIKADRCSLPLSNLYKFAIGRAQTSDDCLSFILGLSKRAPNLMQSQIVEYEEWSRTLDDVINDLLHMQYDDQSLPSVTVTDCKTLATVYSILLSESVVPKILPFATQKEMIEGMIAMSEINRRRTYNMKRSESISENMNDQIRKNAKSRRDSNAIILELNCTPLTKPKKILDSSGGVFNIPQGLPLFPTMTEFLDTTNQTSKYSQ